MQMRQVPLNENIKGSLYLHSMLGRHETWEEILGDLEANQVNKVVCLTSLEEIEKLSPSYAEAIAKNQLPFEKLTLAISDFGIPDDENGFFTAVVSIAKDIADGDVVLIHCAAGIGRTGMLSSCLLQALGIEEEAALAQIKASGSGPETKEQRDLVSRFSS